MAELFGYVIRVKAIDGRRNGTPGLPSSRACSRNHGALASAKPHPSPRTSRNGTRRSPDASRGVGFPDKTFEAPCPEQCPCGGKVGAKGASVPGRIPETWKFVVGLARSVVGVSVAKL